MARCDLCKQFDDCAFRSDPDAQCSEFERKPMTNGDCIRQMSDEELAGNIISIMQGWCPNHASDCGITCRQCLLDWLREETTDDT